MKSNLFRNKTPALFALLCGVTSISAQAAAILPETPLLGCEVKEAEQLGFSRLSIYLNEQDQKADLLLTGANSIQRTVPKNYDLLNLTRFQGLEVIRDQAKGTLRISGDLLTLDGKMTLNLFIPAFQGADPGDDLAIKGVKASLQGKPVKLGTCAFARF